ncbi:winged helix-turn-helix domain-containing protein [Candidatus Pantoea soli]|uniref:Response regulator n=1 Tax=Candidatus Pantoea soli TaxID=3098669 RepID=A0A518XJD3_9GAMM|nr:winged helix-turn-helix domain-containing protein [Pantoea soli]QDY44301.1 response regulator [Pantoea soli]
MRILIFDRNQASSRYASVLMSQLGFLTDTFSDTDNALRSLKKFCPDVFIISTHILSEQHCALIRRYRRRGFRTPVIVTTMESTTALRIAAYEAGADDLVSGDIVPEEFVARISAIVRRSQGHSSNRIALPPYELDLSSKQLLKDGTQVDLTNFEYVVAESLIKRCGKVVTRDELMSQLYLDADLRNQDVINVLICRLKKKLCGDSGFKIKSIRGLGYIFRSQ